jgi:hypothetical protein
MNMDDKEEKLVTDEQASIDRLRTYRKVKYNSWARDQKEAAINKLPNEFRGREYTEATYYEEFY